MTQEDKELLFKDLCARLPYRVVVETQLVNTPRAKYPVLKVLKSYMLCDFMQTVENVIYKPYLFPLSSMTKEEKEEYCQLQQRIIYNSKGAANEDVTKYINWCYKKYLDINNLIPMGLAIDATNLNIY